MALLNGIKGTIAPPESGDYYIILEAMRDSAPPQSWCYVEKQKGGSKWKIGNFLKNATGCANRLMSVLTAALLLMFFAPSKMNF